MCSLSFDKKKTSLSWHLAFILVPTLYKFKQSYKLFIVLGFWYPNHCNQCCTGTEVYICREPMILNHLSILGLFFASLHIILIPQFLSSASLILWQICWLFSMATNLTTGLSELCHPLCSLTCS